MAKYHRALREFELMEEHLKMALANENLYKSDNQTEINFRNYLTELFNELKRSLTNLDKIETEIDCSGYQIKM